MEAIKNAPRKLIMLVVLFAMPCIGSSATLFNQEIFGIHQYGLDGLTVIYLKNDFVSPNGCADGPWGNKAILLRTSELNSDRILSVALAAYMAGKKVDIAVKNSCDGNTESLHYIIVKG